MRAIALFALTGCTQIFGLSDPARQAPADASGSADAPMLQDVAIDTRPSGSCDPTANGLIACFDFEGEVVDRSPSGHVVTTVANVDFNGTGGPAGAYAGVGLTSAITLAASTSFNTSAFTITAWVRVDALPASGMRVGVFDADGRYGMFIDPSGSVLVRGVASAPGTVTLGTWTHISVTDDGNTVAFYINSTVMMTGATSPVPTSNLSAEIGGNAPTGDRLEGAIDKLRVFRRVLSGTEIAAEAAL